MKKIDKRTQKSLFNFNLVSFMPLWFITGLVAAIIGANITEGSGFFSIVAFTFGFLYPSSFLTSRRVRKLNTCYEIMSKSVIAELPRCDYINIGEYGAICVDAESRTLAVVAADRNLKVGKPHKFSFDKVKNYSASSPGHEAIELIGNRSLTAQSEVLRKNAYRAADSHYNTGLTIFLDDIDQPKLFVQMAYDEAEKWSLIFEKLKEKTLEKQPAPMLFPRRD